MKNLRIAITVLSFMLIGCNEFNDNMRASRKKEILETKVIDFMLTSWDYDDHFVLGVDSIWVEEDFLKKKSNEELLFSNRFYFTSSELKEVSNFIVNHPSIQINKKGLANNEKVVIITLYGTNSEVLLNVMVQHPYSEKYFREFKKYLSKYDEKSRFGIIIQNLEKYDNILKR